MHSSSPSLCELVFSLSSSIKDLFIDLLFPSFNFPGVLALRWHIQTAITKMTVASRTAMATMTEAKMVNLVDE